MNFLKFRNLFQKIIIECVLHTMKTAKELTSYQCGLRLLFKCFVLLECMNMYAHRTKNQRGEGAPPVWLTQVEGLVT